MASGESGKEWEGDAAQAMMEKQNRFQDEKELTRRSRMKRTNMADEVREPSAPTPPQPRSLPLPRATGRLDPPRPLRRTNYPCSQMLRIEWQKHALKACDDLVRKFWLCRQETGLLVVLKCREENSAMEKCVAERTRDEVAFAAFREERMPALREEEARRRRERMARAAVLGPDGR